MNKEGNSFSPFELFYDRFVDNLYEGIDYSEIIYNINKLKKVVYKFNVGVYDNINLYSNRLKRVYIRIKNILENIQDKNENVFGEYYDLYLRHVDVFKEKEEDMVFVIANSFYNDNRIENLIEE
jgi:hemerythrin-like domain-containing protein